jgi:hypothetical protein
MKRANATYTKLTNVCTCIITIHKRCYTNNKKTQIIKAIQEYFMKLKNEQKLCITTYIASATLLLGGTIIHFLLGFSIDKHAIISKSNSIIDV